MFQNLIGRIRVAVLLLVAISVGTANAAARPTATPQSVATQNAFTRGLLWRVTHPNGRTSHLFGTMHLDDTRVTHLPPGANLLFAKARVLMAEVDLNADAQALYLQTGRLQPGRRLSKILDRNTYDKLATIAGTYGLNAETLDTFKPWLATNLIGRPKPRSGVVLDEVLQQRAQAMGKSIHYLETMAELLRQLDTMPLSVQLALLRDTVQQHHTLMQQQRTALTAYLNEDLRALLDDAAQSNDPVARQFNDTLLYRRTRHMLQNMRPQLVRGDAFIAIGAAHLPGSKGLLQLLRNAGYNVARVPTS